MRQNNDVDENDVDAAKYTRQIRYISVDAIITKSTTATAKIYRTTVIQNEVLTSGILLMNESPGGIKYPIRFVHDRTYTQALQLRTGDKIRIEQGRFVNRHGRSDTEFHVKAFTILD